MSRIGKMPIAIPAGVTVDIAENNKVTVKGPKGELSRVLVPEMSIKIENNEVVVERPNDVKKMKALHGLTRSLINNMVIGVTDGYEKHLEIVGVGYRVVAKSPTQLEFSLGFSHPVVVDAPEGITFEVITQTSFKVHGIDKQVVGQFAANIRKIRKPEPYKGKGVRYSGEHIRRKVGKAGK